MLVLSCFVAGASAAEKKKAEDFTLQDTRGKAHHFSDYRGKVVLLNFWATWCRECTGEIPSLNRLQDRLGPKGFTVLSISEDDSEKALTRFLRKNPVYFPVLKDPEKKVGFDLYAVVGLPANFLIDKDGYIVGTFFGPRDWSSDENTKMIERLFKQND